MRILRVLSVLAFAFWCAMLAIMLMKNLNRFLGKYNFQKGCQCQVKNETLLQAPAKKDSSEVCDGCNSSTLTRSEKELETLTKELDRILTVPDFMKYTMGITQAEYKNILVKFCLPKIICEFNAIDSENLKVESGLIDIGKSIVVELETKKEYHFASAMGCLFRNVDEFYGCYNMYPNCPLSQKELLQLAMAVHLV